MLTLPFRIGVAYGEVHIEPGRNLFLGQPLVDAYLTERTQDWLGGALHSSAAERYQQLFAVAAAPRTVVPYAVPVHHKWWQPRTKRMLAINWSQGITGTGLAIRFEQAKSAAGKKHADKYERAWAFYERHHPAAR